MPYKVFVAGEEALAADANSYLMSQTVPRFTNATQRTSQLTAPVLNQLSMLDSVPGRVDIWNGSAWVSTREIAYAERTSPLAPTATTAATANSVVSTGAVSYDGSPILLELFVPQVQTPAAVGGSIMLNVWDSSTDLGYLAQVATPAAVVLTVPVYAARRLTPSVGTHSYGVNVWVPAGTGGSVGAGPGGINALPPAFVRISRAT